MITDEWFDIMLYAKSNQLKVVCMTNKNTLNICSNKAFWYKKFNHDGLPIINPGNTINQWIKEYEYVDKTMHTVEKLIMLLKSENNATINFKIPSTSLYHQFITDKIQNDFIENFKGDTENIELSFDLTDPIELTFLPIESDDSYGSYGFESHDQISLNDMKNIFFKIFYYYPSVDPDDDYLPYMDGPKMHNMFIRLYRYLQSSQKATLENRLDFWSKY